MVTIKHNWDEKVSQIEEEELEGRGERLGGENSR